MSRRAWRLGAGLVVVAIVAWTWLLGVVGAAYMGAAARHLIDGRAAASGGGPNVVVSTPRSPSEGVGTPGTSGDATAMPGSGLDAAPDARTPVHDGLSAAPRRQGYAGAEERTATQAEAGPTPVPPVDYPDLPDVSERAPLSSTDRFDVHAAEPDDALLLDLAARWAPELDELYAAGAARVGGVPGDTRIDVVFTRRYAARCPARGLAAPLAAEPYIAVYVDERTSDEQIRAVLAHEMGHHLTITDGYVGDGVLTEGLANWVAEEHMLRWLGIAGWDDAVRDYIATGEYVSVVDETALSPSADEDCIELRDRVYTIRTAFVAWLIERYGLETVLHMPAREAQADGGDHGGSGGQQERAAGEQERAGGEAAVPGGGSATAGGGSATAGGVHAVPGDGDEAADAEGHGERELVPDYEAATSKSLVELEETWLSELLEGGT